VKFFTRANREEELFAAVRTGQLRKAVRALKKGADANARNGQGRTPLHQAVAGRKADFVELLAGRGADINAGDKTGETPLHIAADADDRQMAELLIANGADVNAGDRKGRTPLHIAALKHHTALVEALVDRDADVNRKDKYGETPLELARHKLTAWDALKANAARGYKDTAVLDEASEGYVAISRLLRNHGAAE
jgi:ankyrin repeat protein